MEKQELLINDFVETSALYGLAQENGDSKLVNKCSKKRNLIIQNITKSADFKVAQLTDLLAHPNDYVRLYSAYYSIPYAPIKAKETLLSLSEKKRLLGFEAKMILSEWEKGNLRF